MRERDSIKTFVGFCLLGLAFGGASLAKADTMFASFEDTPGAGVTGVTTPTGSGTNYTTYGPGSVLDGWAVTAGSTQGVDVIHDAYSPTPFPDGSQAVDLNGLNTGGLTQDFTSLTPDTTYSLSFYLSGNGVSSPPVPNLDLHLIIQSGTADISETFTASAWTKYTVPVVVGSDGHANITFQSENSGTGGPTIDAIRLAAVPLPRSLTGGSGILAMIALGKLLGLVKGKRTMACEAQLCL